MASEKPSEMASEFDDDDDDIVTQAYDNYCENDDSELNSASNEVITPAVISKKRDRSASGDEVTKNDDSELDSASNEVITPPVI